LQCLSAELYILYNVKHRSNHSSDYYAKPFSKVGLEMP